MNVYAIGDIHGSFTPIKNFLEYYPELSNDTVLILLGDVGFNYYLNDIDKQFKNNVKNFPFTLFCVRGNHEQRPSILAKQNPDEWHLETFFDNQVLVENEFPNIKYALDIPAVYNICGYKTLIIPGAYSIDKYFRLRNHWPWFEQEQLSDEEISQGLNLIKNHNYNFDLVLSHTCPISYEPSDLFLSTVDQSLVEKKMERFLENIEYSINYKLWLWGHFHKYRRYPYVDNKQCVMLSAGEEAINVLKWLKNPENYHIKYIIC